MLHWAYIGPHSNNGMLTLRLAVCPAMPEKSKGKEFTPLEPGVQVTDEEQKEEEEQTGSKHVHFMGYDKAAMELLPRYVQEQMPFVTTHRGAVDTVLLNLIKVVAISEVGFKGIMDKLKELHCINFYRTMLTYYSVAQHLNGPMCECNIGDHMPGVLGRSMHASLCCVTER